MPNNVDYEGLAKALIALITALATLVGLLYKRLKESRTERRNGNESVVARMKRIEVKLDKALKELSDGRHSHVCQFGKSDKAK